MGTNEIRQFEPVRISGQVVFVDGNKSSISVYNVLGRLMFNQIDVDQVQLKQLPSSIYLVQYAVDGKSGVLKFAK